MNENSGNKYNANKNVAFISTCLIGTIFESMFPFLELKDGIEFQNSCKSVMGKIDKSVFASQFCEKLGKKVGLSFEFKDGGLSSITISHVKGNTLARDYCNKIKVLHILQDGDFIAPKDFSFCIDCVDSALVRYIHSCLRDRPISCFLSEIFNEILKKDGSLFFKCFGVIRKFVDNAGENNYGWSQKEKNTLDVAIRSNMMHLVCDLLNAVYKKEKNMASVFDFAADFLNRLFYNNDRIYSYRREIDELVLRRIFEHIVLLAKKNNNKVDFKYLVDFCRRTQCLDDHFQAFNSEDFVKIFKGKISSLEDDYNYKVANELRKKLGDNNYLSLWKKEDRKNKSVKTKGLKFRSSERLNKTFKK